MVDFHGRNGKKYQSMNLCREHRVIHQTVANLAIDIFNRKLDGDNIIQWLVAQDGISRESIQKYAYIYFFNKTTRLPPSVEYVCTVDNVNK